MSQTVKIFPVEFAKSGFVVCRVVGQIFEHIDSGHGLKDFVEITKIDGLISEVFEKLVSRNDVERDFYKYAKEI